MALENAISGTAQDSPISVQLGLDLVTELSMAYGFHNFHDHQTIQRPLVPCGWGHCHSIVMVAKLMACPAFFTLTMMGC